MATIAEIFLIYFYVQFYIGLLIEMVKYLHKFNLNLP